MMNTPSQYSIQDLCSHRGLIRAANHHYRGDKSQEHMELIETFEELVDRVKAIVLEKVKYVEKLITVNQKIIEELIFGRAGQSEGLIEFIKEKVLETSSCEEALKNPVARDGTRLLSQSTDLDELIRERFVQKTRNRIHYKVFDYLYKVTQVLIADHTDSFLVAQNAPREDAARMTSNLVALLRFIDCLTWDNATPYEEARNLASLKADYAKAMIKIADQSEDLRVIKLIAAALGNAAPRAWPIDSECLNRLLAKFVAFAEAGERLTKDGLLHGKDPASIIDGSQKSLMLRLDFEPDKVRTDRRAGANSGEPLDGEEAAAGEDADDDAQDSSASTGPGGDLLAHLAEIQVASTSASGGSGSGGSSPARIEEPHRDKPKVRSTSSSLVEVTFESGLGAYLEEQSDLILNTRRNDREQQEAEKMQIDSGAARDEEPSAPLDLKVTLRDIAERIFSSKYEEKRNEWTEKHEDTASSDSFRPKPLKKFKAAYPTYVEDTVSQIEANLILSKSLVNEEALSLAAECAIHCQRRLIQKEEQFAGGKFSRRTCETVQKLIFQNVGQSCIAITTSSVNMREPQARSHVGKCAAMLQTLKQALRKMKDTQAVSGLGQSEVIQALLVNKRKQLDLEDDNQNARPFLIDVLEQVANIEICRGDSEDAEAQLKFGAEQSEQEEGQIDSSARPSRHSKGAFPVSRALLADHRFQSQIWLVAQQVYEILCSILRHNNLPSMSPEQHQQFMKLKKEIENLAQRTMLKNVLQIERASSGSGTEASCFYFPHHLDLLRLIVQHFIRSAWVLEGLVQPAGGEQRNRGDENLQTLIKFTCKMIRAADCENYYLIHDHRAAPPSTDANAGRQAPDAQQQEEQEQPAREDQVEQPVHQSQVGQATKGGARLAVAKDDLVTFIYFLVRRLALDNRAPNHPPAYDATIIQSELFKDEIFGKIVAAPIEDSSIEGSARGADTFNNSRLKNVFIQYLGTICSNDPAQIPKVIDNGTLKKVVDALQVALPVQSSTHYVLFDFVRTIAVHEQGREFVKQHKAFEKLMRPSTAPIASADGKGGETRECDLAMVMQASNHDRHRRPASMATSELLRHTDEYFAETIQAAVAEIVAFLKPKAQFLQREYYQYLAQCAADPTISKRSFQIAVTERLIEHADYHIMKFEVDKLHALCYSSHYDSSALTPHLIKVFKGVLDQLLELFEILSTIKPIYDFGQRGGLDRQNNMFGQFGQIFTILIHEGRNSQYPDGVRTFERRLRQACAHLAGVFSEAKMATTSEESGKEKELQIKYIDLMEFLKVDGAVKTTLENEEVPISKDEGDVEIDDKDQVQVNDEANLNAGQSDRRVPADSIDNEVFNSIELSNVRGHLIARVLIVGQYINVFEGTRKSTQEMLCVTKEWSKELRILSCFMTSFNECNHKITDEFFQDQRKFVELGVVTQDQIQEISIPYRKSMTTEEKNKFAENRKQIEENIDKYRENLTYLDPDYININRLLQIVWEFWRAPSQRRGNSVDELIISSKKSYTQLTIDNIRDMNKVVDAFERLRGDFNSTEFLTTISRLYTYISELHQLIVNEKLCGITFYQFVDQGCLSQLIKIFNIIKTFSIKKHGLEQDPSMQIKFIAVDCIQSIDKQLRNVLTYFINCSQLLVSAYTPNMQTIIRDDGLYDSTQHFFVNYVYNLIRQLVEQETSEDGKSTSAGGKGKIELYENKDLRALEILLLQNISTGFEKCKYLKDEHGDPANPGGDRTRMMSGRGGEPAKPKKLHHDESLLAQITAMGFDRKLAKKALKLTGDVSNAVTFLLETGEAGLVGLSDSEEDGEQNAGESQKAGEEATKEDELKKAEELRNDRRSKLIGVGEFRDYLKSVQDTGLGVVTEWATFTAEQAKMIPYKTQKKYTKLFDQYVLSLAKSSNKNEKELVQIFDRILDAYVKNVQKISLLPPQHQEPPKDDSHPAQQIPSTIQSQDVASSTAQSLSIENLTVLYQDTKNQLALLHRLTTLDSYKPILRLNRHERSTKLIENVTKTVRSLTVSNGPALGSNQMLTQGDEMGQRSERVRFVYLSNVLELLYRSLLLFLIDQQRILSKRDKCEHKIQELEKEEKLRQERNLVTSVSLNEKHSIASLKQKQQGLLKKLEELEAQKAAQDTLKFIQLLQQNSYRIKVPKKYASELSLAIGQIIDISRVILLSKRSDDKQDDSAQELPVPGRGLGSQGQTQLVLCSDKQQSAKSMTTGTATLNIIQIQTLAFSEERLQSQIQYLIKWMMEIKAQRIAQYNKSRLENQDDDKSDKSSESRLNFEQKDSVQDFKAFVGEFQSQVLGIGKAPNSAQNQQRYGGAPAAPPQNLSQPSNELANQMFSRIFRKAIAQTCDVTVRQEKPQEPPAEQNSESFKAQLARLKSKNMKEALTTSKIQLRQEVIEQIKHGSHPDKSQVASELKANDEKIYTTIFEGLKECSQPWCNELQEFVSLQKSGSKFIAKITRQESENDCSPNFVGSSDALDQWRELSLIELRNLSSLARVYIDQESGLLQQIIDGAGRKDELNLVEWFKQVYLPLRLLNRRTAKKVVGEDEAAAEQSSTLEIWYELDQSSQVEKMDKNVCLFLNELTGYGHVYCEEAKEQRQALRHQLLISCLQTLQIQAQNKQGVRGLTVLQQAQILSCLLVIQHLINQYNQFEYNRVVLSRECYSQSIRVLFDYGQEKDGKDKSSGSGLSESSAPNMRFVQIVNEILGQVVKTPASSPESSAEAQENDRKNQITYFASLQTLSTLIIERSLKIFTTVALFLEGEKKREKQLKEEQKKKKELQLAKAKKRAEDKKKKELEKAKQDSKKDSKEGDELKPGVEDEAAQGRAAGEGAEALAQEAAATGLNAGSSLAEGAANQEEQKDDAQSPDDALMQADSDDDDDDIHGEGSRSQQQDLQMQENQLQQQQQMAADDEGHNMQGIIGDLQNGAQQNLIAPQVDDDYGDEQDQDDDQDNDEDDDEDQDDMDDDEDHLDDEQIIIQQQVEMHNPLDPNVLMVDEDEEELIEGELDEQDDGDGMGDDEEEEDEMDDDFDDLPSDEDEGGLFLPMGMGGHHARARAGGRNQQQNQRDILFNVPEGAAGVGLLGPPGDRMRLDRAGGPGFGYQVRVGGAPHARDADGSINYGPNWSREEEEVSQALRNLRGLSINGGGNPAMMQAPPQAAHPLSQPQSCRYRIELDISRQFVQDSNQQHLGQAKKSIEQIKQEQAKPLNNQLSTIFQILKPIDLQGQCAIAQAIDQEFLKGASTRENKRIEAERAERQERLERKKNGQALLQSELEIEQELERGLYGDDSEGEDSGAAIGHGDGAGGPLLAPSGLFRDGPVPGGPHNAHGMIQDRLMDIRQDIERLLQEGMPGGLRDPILDMEDPFGLGGIFAGGPGYPPRHWQRERERVNQANAQRDAREQAANWDAQLFRAPETSVQDHAQNLIHGLIEEQQVVIDEVEVPVAAAAREEDAKSSEMSQSRPSRSRSQDAEEQKSSANANANNDPGPRPAREGMEYSVNLGEQIVGNNELAGGADRPNAAGAQFQDINAVMASLRMGQDPPSSNQNLNPLPPDEQQALNSFFSSLNQPNQPAQVAQPNQEPSQAEQPASAQAPENNGNDDALAGGMGGISQALDQIRDEMQNSMQQLDQAVERVAAGGDAQDQAEVQEPGEPVAQEAQPEQMPAQEMLGSSLAGGEDEQLPQAQAEPVPQEELKVNENLPVAQPEASAQAQAPALPEVEMTFGYPNSLLRENDIDPAMLYEFPEELRAEILSTIQDQFEEWQRNRQNQQNPPQLERRGSLEALPDQAQSQQNEGQSQEQQEDVAQAQSDPVQEASALRDQQQPLAEAEAEAPAQVQPPAGEQQEQQPVQAPAQLDPEVAQAIAMGLDPDFLASIPPDMRRELIQSESLRLANAGPGAAGPPQRAPEPMDVASIIATVQDPQLRREMLQNLSQEQIDALPSALRTEAFQGRDRPLFGGPPGQHGHIGRPPRNLEQMMAGGRAERAELERQMDLVVNRIGGAGHPHDGDLSKKILPDPREIAFDKLLMDYTTELDRQLQDEQLQSEKSLSLIKKIQEQLLEDKEHGVKGSKQLNDDMLLKNILTTICLNSNVKTDIVQFLRLILKQKTQIQSQPSSANINQNDHQYGYQCRNKIINTLTFVMKIAARKDTDTLLALFEIELPENKKSRVKVSDLQWNKIFLTVTGILRVLIDNNKKLILHMLKCLIQRDEYFVNKGDHLVSSHAKLLEKQADKSALRPPLAEIIQIMREQSEEHQKNSKKQKQNDDEKRLCQESVIRVRNVKLLIQDVFKQFDLLFNEIALQQQAAAQQRNARKDSSGSIVPQQGINLGELSQDSVHSLTDLLHLPLIDKKLLTALGDFFFRLSNLKDQSTAQKCEEKNLRNWSMISSQCKNIAKGNLEELNDLLLNSLMIFSTFDIEIVDWNLNRTPSQMERAASQISSGARQGQAADQIMQDEGENGRSASNVRQAAAMAGASGPAQAPGPVAASKKMTKDQEEQFKEQLLQFKGASSPLIHILTLYAYFFTKFTEEKSSLESKIQVIDEKCKQYEDSKATDKKEDQNENQQVLKDEDQEKQQETTNKDGAEQRDAAKKDVVDDGGKPHDESQAAKLSEQAKHADDHRLKEYEEGKKRLEELRANLRQKEEFIQDIKKFFKVDELSMLVQQINQVLAILQQTGADLVDAAKTMVNCVFDCFMPEVQEEVVRVIKERDSKMAAAARRAGRSEKESDAKDPEDSKYVSMEPIKKIVSEADNQDPVQAKIQAEIEGSNLLDNQIAALTPVKGNSLFRQPSLDPFLARAMSTDVKGSKRGKSLIFRDVEDASARLFQFNLFCLQNKVILNKLVKNVLSASARDKESSVKDIITVSEYIKFMPNLLDFENKRMYFKKEIKKLRRGGYARDLRLSIRRKEIFMDAYSQLCHLTPNELKGKMTVDFQGEKGQDVGGITRDFFIDLSKQIFNQNYSLFKNSDNGSAYMPNPQSYVQADHIRYFKFIGRVIGKALFEGCLLECYFVASIYKMLIGQKLNFKDLDDLDHALYEGLKWCLQPGNNIDDLGEMTFSCAVDYFGRAETVDLLPGGRDIAVTNENKERYVERKAYYHLYRSVHEQIDAFLDGFYEIIPRELVSIFTYKELELLISGLPDFSPAELKAHTNYRGYTANSPQIVWFWEVMETLDRAEKAGLLQFVTGSSKVPVEGFACLQGMNGPENFQITRIVCNDPMRLPQGHTCFNQLDLPEYPSKEVLHERLMWAIKETAGFGFA